MEHLQFVPSLCRTPQGVRGLKLKDGMKRYDAYQSHSARSAWIETRICTQKESEVRVALRKECVD